MDNDSHPRTRTRIRAKEGKLTLEMEESKSLEHSNYDSWLESKKGNARSYAEALVTVGVLTNNPDLIRQGIQTDPQNGRLLFIGSTLPAFSKEERMEMSKRLQAAAPDNAMAGYLSAAYLSEAGQTDAALQVLKGSVAQPKMDDYRAATQQKTEEALIAAGLSPETAKIKSVFDANGGHLIQLHSLVKSLKEQESSLSPDEASELRSMTASIGQRIGEQSKSGYLIDRLVAIKIEETTLKGLQDDAPSPYAGLTVSEARESIAAERAELRELSKSIPVIDMKDKALMGLYVDRVRAVGEIEAAKWFAAEYPASVNKE